MCAVAVFTVSFIKIELGLYLLIFSMLLSPEITAGEVRGGAAIGRGLTLRLDDFLLLVIGFSWLAKNAIHKELGLFWKTPLNRPIFFYLAACILSTGFGIMAGRVDPATGFFFVVKYFEYFIVFFMVVNHIESPDQIKRLIFCIFLTCFIISIIGMIQIPTGGRVSAPFEGETGEPNTLGGYLVFTGAIAAGLYSRIKDRKTRRLIVVLLVFMVPPFLYTQSRSSYLALIPVLGYLGFQSEKRVLALGLLAIGLIISPLFLPSVVKDRILYTFLQKPHPGQQIEIGHIKLDTSTSARLVSWKEGVKDWARHPILGYGVTGYRFMDAQFPRVLTETGVVGMAAFIYLLAAVFKLARTSLRETGDRYGQGLALGFIAGFIGLLFHAIGANTFIIVRIMEPFWFIAGIVAVLPALQRPESFGAAATVNSPIWRLNTQQPATPTPDGA